MVSNIKPSLQFALQLRNQGELDKASKIYQQLIELEPNNPIAYDRLAQVQAQQGFFADAIDNYQQALKLGVDSPFWTHKNLGDSLRENGQFEQATSAYQKAIQLNPKNPIAYDALGQVSSMMGNFAESIANYKKAIALGINNSSWTYKNLEEALIKESRFEEADTIRQNFIASQETRSIDNQDVAPPKEEIELSVDNFGFDDLQAKNGEREEFEQEAAPKAQKWLELHQEGDRYLIANRYIEAIDRYQQAIQINPNYFWSYYNLGKALSNTGDKEEAISCWQQAMRLKDRDPHLSYLAVGEIYKETGEISKAVGIYQLGENTFAEPEKSWFVRELKQIQHLAFGTISPKSSEFSPTESNERLFPELDDEEYVGFLYQTFLKRPVDSQGLAGNLEALANNVPRRIVLENILKTQEFANVNNQNILEDLSNAEFLNLVWQLFLGRGCSEGEIDIYDGHLRNGLNRTTIVSEVTKSAEFRTRIENLDLSALQKNTGSVWIMGTDKYITQEEWETKLFEVLCDRARQLENTNDRDLKPDISGAIESYLHSKDTPLVSIITSLYKGREFIQFFLDNITNQTIFSACELIIIDANSPENEFEIITNYLQHFDNIKYIRTQKTIGIYEAWNIGVAQAKGEFLTNANLDDLRRLDCLEKQAEALLQDPSIDLVYQDFYYSLTANLPFEVIAQCGYQSQLPEIATKENMIVFNPPHNAPMWRKSLHEKVGLFNTSYKSAGDYELWMRALLLDAKFVKIDDPVAVYYNNPKGISTRKEGRGVYESREIQTIYRNLFTGNLLSSISPMDFVTLSREEFDFTGDIEEIQLVDKWYSKMTVLDKCFEEKLKNLSEPKFYFDLRE